MPEPEEATRDPSRRQAGCDGPQQRLWAHVGWPRPPANRRCASRCYGGYGGSGYSLLLRNSRVLPLFLSTVCGSGLEPSRSAASHGCSMACAQDILSVGSVLVSCAQAVGTGEVGEVGGTASDIVG